MPHSGCKAQPGYRTVHTKQGGDPKIARFRTHSNKRALWSRKIQVDWVYQLTPHRRTGRLCQYVRQLLFPRMVEQETPLLGFLWIFGVSSLNLGCTLW